MSSSSAEPSATPRPFEYIGSELDAFAHAKNWKAYWAQCVRPFMGRSLLDVGAGIGSTAKNLGDHDFDQWLELEPDATLAERIRTSIADGQLSPKVAVLTGTSQDVTANSRFDTILYIDVLEHIEHDAIELERVSTFLLEGGHIIVLSPAHNWLYTPFDKAIGHHRRYTKKMLVDIKPADLRVKHLAYVDSVGMLASLANKLFLKTSSPKLHQIQIWDRFMVPVSRVLDRLFLGLVGKSILCVYEKPRSAR